MRYELRRLDRIGTLVPNHPNHAIRHIAVKDAIVDRLPSELLVVGAGKGMVEFLLPDGISCTSVDLDEQEIAAAREINRYKRNRKFLVGDIYKLEQELGDKQFPLVSISEVIEHLPDDQAALHTVLRHLKPGGWLIITLPNLGRFQNWILKVFGRQPFFMASDHLREYTVPSARALFKQLGLEVRWWRGVWFDFPRSYKVERFISPYSRFRLFLAWLLPRRATYLLFACRKPEIAPTAASV